MIKKQMEKAINEQINNVALIYQFFVLIKTTRTRLLRHWKIKKNKVFMSMTCKTKKNYLNKCNFTIPIFKMLYMIRLLITILNALPH